MPPITGPIQALVHAALAQRRSVAIDPNEPKVSIPARAAAASFIYERMRNAVDYKEEHLIRRNAIERILRRVLSQGARDGIAENLVHELIHARYLPNSTIPQRNIAALERVFEKYFALLGFASLKDVSDKKSMPGFVLGIMATEVDEFLVPPHVMHASINAMYEAMNKRIYLESAIPPEERAKQIYLAASRALYKNDNDTLAFHLTLVYYPHWQRAEAGLIKEVGANLPELRKKIQADLDHPLKEKLTALLRKHVAYFVILRDVVVSDPDGSWHDLNRGSDAFQRRIRERCEQHYKTSRSSLHRAIRRSIVYLVITKFLLFIVLEIPVDYLLIQHFDLVPIAINVLFPPSLLAIIALSTKLPDEKNTELIIQGSSQIADAHGDIIQVSKKGSRSLLLSAVFVVLYGILFALSFGALVWILGFLNFTAVSIMVFLFFLCLVSLFAYRIRLANQELVVTPPQRGVLRALWSFLTLPVLHAGKWMSARFENINVFIFALDFVIEAPFKAFVKVIEEWMNYVYEKKEEI